VIAGIKPAGTPDLTVVVNDGPHDVAAGVFTTNKVKAAPVLWSQQVLTAGRLKAVVLNSGGANCFTGAFGFQTTHQTAERVAERLGIGAVDVQVCSTGLIGVGDEAFRAALLQGVDLTGVGVQEAKKVDLPDWAEEVVAARNAPLIFMGYPRPYRAAVFAFDLRPPTTNLFGRVGFPVLGAVLHGPPPASPGHDGAPVEDGAQAALPPAPDDADEEREGGEEAPVEVGARH
jgi:hypothetical protein